jgi:hypothetical protein
VWILAWAGGDEPAHLAFVRANGSTVDHIVPLPEGAEPTAMQAFDDVLWIGSLDGTILRYDIASDALLDGYQVEIAVVDILVEEDLFGSDLSVWVSGLDGGIVKLRANGSIVVDERINGRRVLLTGGGNQGAAWAVTVDGSVHYAGEPGPPLLVRETGVSEVDALVFDGGRLWLLGDTLEVVEFGQ